MGMYLKCVNKVTVASLWESIVYLTLWCFLDGKNCVFLAWHGSFWVRHVDGGFVPGLLGLCCLAGWRFVLACTGRLPFYYDASLNLPFIAAFFRK